MPPRVRFRAPAAEPRGVGRVPRRPRSRSRSRSRSSERLLARARQADAERRLNLIDHWRERERAIRHIPRGPVWAFELDQSALHSRFMVYRFTHDDYDYSDLVLYLAHLKRALLQHLHSLWIEHEGIAWSIQINIEYESGAVQGVNRVTGLHSSYMNILTASDIRSTVEAALAEIDEQNTEFQEGRSDWRIVEIREVGSLFVRGIRLSNGVAGGGRQAQLARRPGSSYLPLPDWVFNRGCVINVQNRDMLCFRYAMEGAWLIKQNGQVGRHAQRITHYPESHFNYGDLTFPIHPTDLNKFERLNKELDFTINVYYASDEPGEVSIIHHGTQHSNAKWVINLLMITDTAKNQSNTHWCLITRLENLLRAGQAKTQHKRYLCSRCTRDFKTQTSLDSHSVLCVSKKAQVEVLPFAKDAYRYFKDTHKKTEKPFVIYADFESFNKVIENAPASAVGSKKMTKHIPASYCFQVVCRKFPELNSNHMYSYDQGDWGTDGNTDVGKRFTDDLLEVRDKLRNLINDRFMHTIWPMTKNQANDYKNASHCCVCNLHLKNGSMRHWEHTLYSKATDFDDPKEFYRLQAILKKSNKRGYVSDDVRKRLLKLNQEKTIAHFPWMEENNYRGACHFACSQSITKYGKIPVIFHNLTGYDGHLVMQSLDSNLFFEEARQDQFSAIPQAGDKFMSFSFSGLEFLDSYRFMGSKLETLTDNLRKNGESAFTISMTEVNKFLAPRGVSYDADVRTLLMKKGQFPYEYFDHPRRMEEQSLPPIKAFFNTMENEECPPKKYEHAEEVWTKLNCQTFRDYHDAYLILDVVLLADIFESFRTLCMKEDGLDPVNYVSLPGYTLDSALMFSKIPGHFVPLDIRPFEIELFKKGQEDMYEFVEASIRGGISMTPGRYARANHKYMKEQFDQAVISSFILYLDANNLYGYAMSQALPSGDYQWVKDDRNSETIMQGVMAMKDDDPIGLILEVDGYFPDSKHDYLSDFPPVPINESIPTSQTSPYYQSLCEKFESNHDDRSTKLLCNLLPKTRYKVYYRSLQQYVSLGFEVTQVHRMLSFSQSRWLAPYIQYNTEKRARATNDFEKDYYKLKNNAAYGKFIQDNRKFQTVQAVNPDLSNKATWDPAITHFRIINDNLVLAYMKRGRIQLNSPIPIGAVILDHSKWLMYNFWYFKLKPVFGDRLRLLFTDTDSLCIQIQSEDVMIELKENNLLADMDLADWPKDDSYYGHYYYDPINKKIIGKFKDEFAGDRRYIREVVALRSKMYSVDFCEQKSDKCADYECKRLVEPNSEWCSSHSDEKSRTNKATAKGVSRAVKQSLTHLKYLQCLESNEDYALQRAFMHRIGSVNNQLYSSMLNKITLSPTDSKLYLLDGIHTLPYGHYRIPQPMQVE